MVWENSVGIYILNDSTNLRYVLQGLPRDFTLHCWMVPRASQKKKKNGSSVAEARTGIPNFQLYTYATLTKRT